MCKLNVHDSQGIEIMGSHDFTQLQHQPQQMLTYNIPEAVAATATTTTASIPVTASTTPPQQQQEQTSQHSPDNIRSSRPIRRASRRTSSQVRA